MDEERTPRSTASLLASYTPPGAPKKATERGELLKYFADKLGAKIGFVAFKVASLKVEDLYFIKSSCDLYERDGNPWGKGFYGMLKQRS